jgi:DNA invertase Pin-like site-specific DNA recombinase
MDAVIYLRVSTKEQANKDQSGEGYSIPAQREACLRHMAERGWNLAEEFTDAGESARTADRPMLKAMLRRVAEGGVGVVVVHKIDRLARSMEDHVAIRAALRHAGVQLVSVTENIEETASGRLVEGIHALMAEFFSANLAGEIRKGMTQKAKMGGWPTKAPIGYLNVRERIAGKEIAKVVLDPERALLVREAFRLYATGEYALPELQATMHAKGLTSPYARRPGAPVSVSKLAETLANPFYVGVVQWGGARYEGQHKALIPQSLFDRAQETLRARDVAGTRQRRHEHYLKGLLHCGECGRRLSLTLAKGRYLYFYCLGQRGTARTRMPSAVRPRRGCRGARRGSVSTDPASSVLGEAAHRGTRGGDRRSSGRRIGASRAPDQEARQARGGAGQAPTGLLRERDPPRSPQGGAGPHRRGGAGSQGRARDDGGRPRRLAGHSPNGHPTRGQLPRGVPEGPAVCSATLQRRGAPGRLHQGSQDRPRQLLRGVRTALLSPEFE